MARRFTIDQTFLEKDRDQLIWFDAKGPRGVVDQHKTSPVISKDARSRAAAAEHFASARILEPVSASRYRANFAWLRLRCCDCRNHPDGVRIRRAKSEYQIFLCGHAVARARCRRCGLTRLLRFRPL